MFRSAVLPIAGVLTLSAVFLVQAPEANARGLAEVLDSGPVSVEFRRAGEVSAPTLALRHLSLRSSAPANRATVEPPTEIRLWFSERPQARSTALTLIGPNGDPVRLGDVTADAGDDRVYFARPDAALSPGAYRVAWRTMAQDGHVIRGEFTFTVALD